MLNGGSESALKRPRESVGTFAAGGGSYFLEGGSRKGGFGRTPRTPPGYGPAVHNQFHFHQLLVLGQYFGSRGLA